MLHLLQQPSDQGGAAPDRFMTHVAICDGLADGRDGPETEWGEHVTYAEYNERPA